MKKQIGFELSFSVNVVKIYPFATLRQVNNKAMS